MKFNGIVLDTEADGFYFESTKMWCLSYEHLDNDDKGTVLPFKDKDASRATLLAELEKYENPMIVFHYGLGYDIFVILKFLDIPFTVGPDTFNGKPCRFIDTFYLSSYLNPDRAGHSVDYFGSILGLPKIDWRSEAVRLGLIKEDDPKGAEFKKWHPAMGVYCERDVAVNKRIFFHLMKEWAAFYPFKEDGMPDHYKCGQKSFFLMSCQELSGWKFDSDAAEKLLPVIAHMMEEIRSDVEPQLPPRSLKKGEQKDYTMPAKPFKKDGSLSSHMLNFIEKHHGKALRGGDDVCYEFYGERYSIESKKSLDVKLPMEMANQDQLKDWLLELGWKPTFWNFKRGPDNKPMRCPLTRQLIQTTPKIQEAQKICPNLEEMDMPIIKQVVKWLSLRNRQSVLTGWLANDRLKMDGRIGAGRKGIASTHRQKHQVLVNVPKASEKVLLGYEFRSLFTSEEGFLIAAGDAAALEGRVQGHYTYKYDNGATARELLDGDIHSKTAMSVYAEELAPLLKETGGIFLKDDPRFKPYRDRSKNIYYAIMYGAGPAKVAKVAGLPESRGAEISKRFWEANAGTATLKERLEAYWNTKGKKKYLPAIDGRILNTRKKSALLNTIFQSCGGIVMDYAGCFMDLWLGGIKFDENGKPHYIYKGFIVRRIGYFHDELEYECQEAIAHEVSKMIEKAIEKAGKHLKIAVPLAGEGKVGKTWKEVH